MTDALLLVLTLLIILQIWQDRQNFQDLYEMQADYRKAILDQLRKGK